MNHDQDATPAANTARNTPVKFDRYIGPRALAERIERSEKTLRNWRSEGNGPPWYKREGVIMYDLDEVTNWLTERGHAG
ncbi:hypothetical protein [Pseudoclavibacter endophyticus]|uniref:Helix-turn-helix domain-containing protein n=1 Tax=Pseudoclavibacter endophyticus TaxID=1778590 RepID=A0A6H9WB62_9MICO|nr:hypothetical protein [Pseudoclavibacter endophyticus]KAB1647790.1 hypothetical protein F8O04_12250 [Pseudoclavibacter endophyticus]